MKNPNNEPKTNHPKRTVAFVLVVMTCILAFSIVFGATLLAQGATAEDLHILSQPQSSDVPVPVGDLDIQVTATSLTVPGILAPDDVVPIAQEIAKRVFNRDLNGFIMLDCQQEIIVDTEGNESMGDYMWHVYAYTGQTEAVDLLLDAATGRDLSCAIDSERHWSAEDVKNVNTQAGDMWNAYQPVAPPEYVTSGTQTASADSRTPEEVAEAARSMLEFYQGLRRDTLAYIEQHRNDPEVARARQFAEESGILGDAKISDVWLLMRTEGDSPRGYGDFLTFEIQLDNGEWITLGMEASQGFYCYYRPEYSQTELYELEIERLEDELQ